VSLWRTVADSHCSVSNKGRGWTQQKGAPGGGGRKRGKQKNEKMGASWRGEGAAELHRKAARIEDATE